MPTSEAIPRILSTIENNSSKVLGMSFDGQVVEMKQYIPRAEAQTAPSITYPIANPLTTYLAAALDLDAPFISAPFMSPILHWVQPGFSAGPNGTLTSSEPAMAKYAAPGPPPGAAPHRYVFFLFEQPSDFNTKPIGALSRVRFDFDNWLKTAKLADPVAGSYFLSN